MVKNKSTGKGRSPWDPEEQFDLGTTLDELISEPPFKEASGGSGDSNTAGARIPMWLERRAMRLVEMQGSPYYVKSDVYRDAIYIGLRVLNMRHHMNPDWDVETKMASIVDAASTSKRIKRQVRELVDGLDDLWKDGEHIHATESLTKYVYAALEMDSGWFKRRLFKFLVEDGTIKTIASECDAEVWETIEREAK